MGSKRASSNSCFLGTKDDLSPLCRLILDSEDWLMDRILFYAKARGYTQYTSTLRGAWRLSIGGLSESLLSALRERGWDLELGPDDDYEADPAASFGIVEAQRHRERGVNLAMFLGLMKYYRQAYQDLVETGGFTRDYGNRALTVLERFFDRVEIGFCTEWASAAEDDRVRELQVSNRLMTNEKNKYLTIFESQPNPVILVDRGRRVDNFNQAASAFFRTAKGPGGQYYCAFRDRHMEGLETGDDEEPFALGGADVREMLPWLSQELEGFAGGERERLHFSKGVSVDNRFRYLEVQLSRMLDVSGKFCGTVISLQDRTIQKKAEVACEEREASLRSIFRAAPTGIGVVRDRYFIRVNDRLCEMMGYTRAELVGESARILYPDDEEFQRVGKIKYGQDEKDRTDSVETRWRRKDGTIIDVLLSSTPLNPSDLRAGVTFTALDITTRKQAEQALEKANRALGQTVSELQKANRMILEQQKALVEEERLKVLLQMSGATAHELNQPLMVLLGNLDLLKMEQDPDKRLRYLVKIERAGERISDIVKKIQNIRHYETTPYAGNTSIIRLDQGDEKRAKGGPRPQLGQILVAEGMIDEKALSEALEKQDRMVGQSLVEAGRVTAGQLDEALTRTKPGGQVLGEVLKGMGYVTNEDLLWASRKKKRKLGEILVDAGLVRGSQLSHALAIQRQRDGGASPGVA